MDVFILPDNIREKFKRPYGRLFKNLSELEKFKDKFKDKFIISVGDIVSNSLLSNGWDLNLWIYDNKTLRNEIVNEKSVNFEHENFEVWNPQGMLTKNSLEVVKKALNFKHSSIFVDGEEDLFVIPCIKFAPSNTVLFYGQPNEGIVMVEVEKVKEDVENLFMKFYTGVCEEVYAYGHENILSTHKMTFEITKDDYLTKRGDCIIGIKANKGIYEFSEKFKEILRNNASVKIYISCDEFREEVDAKGDKNLILTDETDIVVRKSKFIDNRTIAIMANKSASDLNREMIKRLRNEKRRIILRFVVWKN